MARRKEPVTNADNSFVDDGYPYWSRAEQHKEIVSDIISNGRYNIAELAPYFDCTPQAMRTKYSRGSFSVDDIVLLMCLSGLHLKIYKGEECVQEFEPSTYVRNDKELWSRYSAQKRKEIEAIRQRMADTEKEVESVEKIAAKDAEKRAKKNLSDGKPVKSEIDSP